MILNKKNSLEGRIYPAPVFSKKEESGAGFTLVEMLVSISIIGIMTVIFLVNYHSTNKRSEIIVTAQKLATDIRLTQSYSLGSVEYNGAVPAGGWGVYFTTDTTDNNKYIIYADDGISAGQRVEYFYDNETLEKYKEIMLPSGIIINGITIDDQSRTEAHITFEPPDPITHIRFNPNDHDDVLIELENVDIGATSNVQVNFFGLIDIIK